MVNINREEIEKDVKDISKEFQSFWKSMTKDSVAKQLGFGALTGWCAGFLFTKVGKTAAASVGGTLILLQLAQHQGYVEVKWNRVNNTIKKARREWRRRTKSGLSLVLAEGTHFVEENSIIATGFAGGFLIGLAIA